VKRRTVKKRRRNPWSDTKLAFVEFQEETLLIVFGVGVTAGLAWLIYSKMTTAAAAALVPAVVAGGASGGAGAALPTVLGPGGSSTVLGDS
jgi:Asp-tRNA(Asn)/Glu-tRNA(Gln) amidotransferase A subunit family amidase